MKILDLSRRVIAQQLRNGRVTICIVGLGYVGLPLAALFASEGARVIGADLNRRIVEKIRRGEPPISEHDVSELFTGNANSIDNVCPNCAVQLFRSSGEVFCPHCLKVAEIKHGIVRLLAKAPNTGRRSTAPRALKKMLTSALESNRLEVTENTEEAVKRSDVILITVGTPIDQSQKPDSRPLMEACIQIGRGLTKDTLIVLKSTVAPGTTERLVAPLLEKGSGLKCGRDFGLAHMPERILEGLAVFEFRTLPRIVAGVDRRSTDAAAALFSIFPAPIHTFESPKITEASKLFENVYRDVNIALANELALVCEALGVDVTRVIEAAHTDPKTHILTPGPGVGGYCLTKDPYYLATPSSELGFKPNLILTARSINDQMPSHVVHMVQEVFDGMNRPIEGSSISVLGLAFKGNSGDLRNTPALPIVIGLTAKGAKLTAYDPLVDLDEAKTLFNGVSLAHSVEEAVAKAECILVATDHIGFRRLRVEDLIKQGGNLKAIVDTRHIFDPAEVKRSGLLYRGLGRRVGSERKIYGNPDERESGPYLRAGD